MIRRIFVVFAVVVAGLALLVTLFVLAVSIGVFGPLPGKNQLLN